MDGETLYKTYKPLLFSIAYRLLGSVVDVEDAVQEAFLAWNERLSPADVDSERAYLCRIVVHKCADRIRASKSRRETYVGPGFRSHGSKPKAVLKTPRCD